MLLEKHCSFQFYWINLILRMEKNPNVPNILAYKQYYYMWNKAKENNIVIYSVLTLRRIFLCSIDVRANKIRKFSPIIHTQSNYYTYKYIPSFLAYLNYQLLSVQQRTAQRTKQLPGQKTSWFRLQQRRSDNITVAS